MASTAGPQQAGGVAGPTRARIDAKTLRTDRWWLAPATTFVVFTGFVVFATYRAFAGDNFYVEPYMSPFFSPCIAHDCQGATSLPIIADWWRLSPALIILIFPLGFRMTCYYYRKAYYRSFWLSPPACAVGEPHKKYTGETRFPLILQNIHRYFFYLGLILNCILTYDAVIAFRDHSGKWGHVGLGTIVLVLNAVFLWGYSVGCHSCRNIIAGRLNHFSKHPIRYKLWGKVTWFNRYHMQFAWVSLIWVALTDLYVRLVASGTIHGGWV